MKPLSTSELLNIWERCRNGSSLEKALLLLDVAGSDGDPEDPALLSIGDRDARLLQLREWIFGSRLLNVSICPQCGQRIEWLTNIDEVRLSSAAKTSAASFSLQVDTFNIQFRLPNSYDLKSSSETGYQSNPKKLLTRCVIDVQNGTHNGAHDYEADNLPDEVLDKLDQQMVLEDPQADIRMALSCPECSHSWETQFDIVSYLWTEIDSWANHILQDVAVLAGTFGWSESQILSLSPLRRQVYLDIIRK